MSGELRFQFEPYQRSFTKPVRTSYGNWRLREGLIITLTNSQGIKAQGEIAPLPWFGSETLMQAVQFCRKLGNYISPQQIVAVPDTLPCCQFALESAWLNLTESRHGVKDSLEYCYLLPAGKSALIVWSELYQRHDATTFKWKIGVEPLEKELAVLRKLLEVFPTNVKLRLDANGGLSLAQAQRLLSLTDAFSAIEFVEQPLPPQQFSELKGLNRDFSTVLALDESVANFSQLQQAVADRWSGVYVLKAAIMGYPSRLEQLCRTNDLNCVFSTVFETEVGRKDVLALAQRLVPNRAVGFGVAYFT